MFQWTDDQTAATILVVMSQLFYFCKIFFTEIFKDNRGVAFLEKLFAAIAHIIFFSYRIEVFEKYTVAIVYFRIHIMPVYFKKGGDANADIMQTDQASHILLQFCVNFCI